MGPPVTDLSDLWRDPTKASDPPRILWWALALLEGLALASFAVMGSPGGAAVFAFGAVALASSWRRWWLIVPTAMIAAVWLAVALR